MKVLLVNPIIPHLNMITDFARSNPEAMRSITTREADGPPFALNDLAGIIPEHEVEILDLRSIYDKEANADLDKVLMDHVRRFQPGIVGLSCMTAQANSSIKIFELVKSMDPDIITVIGGLQPSACPDDFKHKSINIIVIGIGKKTFKAVCDALNKNRFKPDFQKIPGIAYYQNQELHYTPQLSLMSRQELIEQYDCGHFYPNRDLTDHYNYRVDNGRKSIHYVNTSMGCTSRCNFCYLWKFYNGFYYYRKPDDIIDELKTLEKYDVIRFCDLHTFGDIQKSTELFEKIAVNGLQHEYIVDVRTDTVVKHPEVFRTAAKAGLKIAIIGLEATSDQRLENFEKKTTINDTVKAMQILNESGVWISGNYIVGCDFTDQDFDNMAQFVLDHPIYFSGFTIMTPFPGTKQYEMLRHEITIDNFDYYNLANAVVKTKLPLERFIERVTQLYIIGLEARMDYLKKYKNS